jgi:predicted flap endonuclease-1-like 5' DNA nuclease
MLGLLVRWAVRLFFFALIAGAVGFVVTRLLGGEDEDFDDYEDFEAQEANFEFNETPVEIDVSGPATSDASTSDTGTPSSGNAGTEVGDEEGDGAATGDNGSGRSSSNSDTIVLDNRLEENAAPAGDLDTSSNGSSDGSRLIDIKGIGPGYESRLRAIGIHTLGDLLDADAQHIVEQAGVNGGVALVEDWKEQARALITEGQE